MNVALTELKDHNARLGDLANRLGYQSEMAFSRAFKRFTGGVARRDPARWIHRKMIRA